MAGLRRTLASGLLLGMAVMLPTPAAAATPIAVQVIVGDSCIGGSGPAEKTVTATLRTPSGALRDRVVTVTDEFGGFFACFSLFFPNTNVNGGDTLRVVIGAQARTIVVPDLSPMIDRVGNVIEGSAAPGSPVSVSILHRNNFRTSRQFDYEVVADGSGHYAVDTTADFNLRGGDIVTVINAQGNDFFGAIALAPVMFVGVANNQVIGAANRGTHLELVLSDENAAIKAVVTAGPTIFGTFQVDMYDDQGRAAYPLAGDRLTATLAADASIEIPVGYLRGNAADDSVDGRCMPNAPYQLTARHRSFTGKTDATGRFSRDLTARMNLRTRDDLSLSCMYATGDIVTRQGFVN